MTTRSTRAAGWRPTLDGEAGLPSRPALLGLLAANALPLVGVLAFGWSLHEVLLLYWLESGVVGVWALPRILLASGGARPQRFGERVLMAAFFVVHYGIFWIGHLVLLGSVFGVRAPEGAAPALPFLVTLAALFVSHGASFAFNFLEGGEHRRTAAMRHFWGPYPRVFVFQTAALTGGWLALALGSPVWTLVVLVALKTVADAITHLAAHRG